MLSLERINVYNGKAAHEYELALPENKSITKKWPTNRKIILHLHFSDITAVQFMHSSNMIYFPFILFYNVVILYFTNII